MTLLAPGRRIFVAGHRGLVGGALVRTLESRGLGPLLLRTRAELDLGDAAAVERFFATERPEVVFLAAARVGGILANSRSPAEFLDENLRIAVNVIGAAHRHGVRKLINFGSACIYPRLAAQPLREDSLLSGPLEPTNEAYAIAKIAAVRLCDAYRSEYGDDFISLMPANLYGPGDRFDLDTSHVIPALLRKMHEAAAAGSRSVTLWGTGTPRRDFLHVDDLAEAALVAADRFQGPGGMNVGSGEELSIRELAQVVAGVVGFRGEFAFDPTRPDGTPRRVLDVSRLAALGWRARISLMDGLAATYRWYLAQHEIQGRNAQAH